LEEQLLHQLVVAKVEVFLVDLEELEDLAEAEAKAEDLEELVTKEVSLHPKEITEVQVQVRLPEAAVEQINQVQIVVVKMVDQVVMVVLG
tara:strand:+ start:385 stop:654 length:270 start_codon:yes stop_codon:yes gene_type:complete